MIALISSMTRFLILQTQLIHFSAADLEFAVSPKALIPYSGKWELETLLWALGLSGYWVDHNAWAISVESVRKHSSASSENASWVHMTFSNGTARCFLNFTNVTFIFSFSLTKNPNFQRHQHNLFALFHNKHQLRIVFQHCHQ